MRARRAMNGSTLCPAKAWRYLTKVSLPRPNGVCADGDRMSGESQNSDGRLATGPRRWWSFNKPQLAASVPDGIPAPQVPKKNVLLGAIRSILGLLAIIFAVVAGCWLVLGMTLLPTVRIDGANWIVQRSAWPEGKAPEGSTMLALTAPVDRGLMSRADILFSSHDDASVVTVVAGPYSDISMSKDQMILVNGKPTSIRVPAKVPSGNTGNTYLTLCRSGGCSVPGSILLVPVDNVLGKVLGSIAPGGLGPFPWFVSV
jgi:hypothetical protein